MVLMLCSSVHSIGSRMHNGRAELLFPTTTTTRVGNRGSDDLFGRRWEDRNEPRRAQPPKDSSERKDGQKGGDIRSGGTRPDIVPVAPPVVAFSLTFPTSSMVIDTGRKLFMFCRTKAYAYPDLGVASS
jgi:hypothetical protein